jgi:hypothetical protein
MAMSGKQPIKLAEAAKRLGISKQAAHQRVLRGQLDAYRDGQGRWWVPWPPDESGVTDVIDGPELPATDPSMGLTPSLTAFVGQLQTIQEVLEQQQAMIEQQAGIINRQHEVVDRLMKRLDREDAQQPSRDEWIVARMREIVAEKPKRPWWKFWQD